MRPQGTLGAQHAQSQTVEAAIARSRVGRQAGIGGVAFNRYGLSTADAAIFMIVGLRCRAIVLRKRVDEGDLQADRRRRFRGHCGTNRPKNGAP